MRNKMVRRVWCFLLTLAILIPAAIPFTASAVSPASHSHTATDTTVNVPTIELDKTLADPVVPKGSVEIDTANGTNYSLFNSGSTGAGRKYGSRNYDDTSYTNGGYDLYAEDGTSVDTIRLGLSFTVLTKNIENINLSIYSYDVDENGSGFTSSDLPATTFPLHLRL